MSHSGNEFHTIYTQFQKQVVKNYDRPALSDEKVQYTYGKLSALIDGMSALLVQENIGPTDVVAVIYKRSVAAVIAMFAIMKIGAIYMPVDQETPREQIMQMLKSCKVKALLCDTQAMKGEWNDYHKIDIHSYQSCVSNESFRQTVNPSEFAYIIHTSGSSGAPKGVLCGHRGVAGLDQFFTNTLRITCHDMIGQFFNISFDGSIFEICMALFTGAHLHIVPQSTILDNLEFTQYVNQAKINVLTLPPAYLRCLDSSSFPKMRMMISAGSASSLADMQSWSTYMDFVNAYGPTETSIIAAALLIPKGYFREKAVSIGFPVSDYDIYIMDENQRILPDGMIGEIVISGKGTAAGYINNDLLTKQHFLPDPLKTDTRMYRTGDIGRITAEGKIEFLGRMDRQIKVRGYRIELEGVASYIRKIPGILDVAVAAHTDSDHEKHICAYVVINDNLYTVKKLREKLLKRMPAYMMPERIFFVEQLPLNRAGKVDFTKLDNPYEKKIFTSKKEDKIEILYDAWTEVLGVEEVKNEDDFLNLGGHSLAFIKLRKILMQKLSVTLTLNEMITHPVFKDMASLIVEKEPCNV